MSSRRKRRVKISHFSRIKTRLEKIRKRREKRKKSEMRDTKVKVMKEKSVRKRVRRN